MKKNTWAVVFSFCLIAFPFQCLSGRCDTDQYGDDHCREGKWREHAERVREPTD